MVSEMMKYCGDSESPFVLLIFPLQSDILSVKSGLALQAKTLVLEKWKAKWKTRGVMENTKVGTEDKT